MFDETTEGGEGDWVGCSGVGVVLGCVGLKVGDELEGGLELVINFS